MGVDITIYRQRIELFSMPRKCTSRLEVLGVPRTTASTIIRLAVFLTILLTLRGDVETNPGPPRPQKQKTLSFNEGAMSPSLNQPDYYFNIFGRRS